MISQSNMLAHRALLSISDCCYSHSKDHRDAIFPFKVSQRFSLLVFPHERFQESPPIIILITPKGFRDPIISFKVPQRPSVIMIRHEIFQYCSSTIRCLLIFYSLLEIFCFKIDFPKAWSHI